MRRALVIFSVALRNGEIEAIRRLANMKDWIFD